MRTAILVGVTVGAGLAAIVAALLPSQPDLRTALARLNPDRASAARIQQFNASAAQRPLEARLGWLVDRYVTRWIPLRVPEADLRMLGRSRQQFFGEKATAALIGALFPYAATMLLTIFGVGIPFTIPVLASLVLAALFSFIPDYDLRKKTSAAREEFALALAAYTDLVALERAGGEGPVSALEGAAQIGDSWVFRRLREELARARWAGQTPWAGMQQLADELRLPELTNLADIMRQSGESGAAIYEQLRARARGMRSAQLSTAQARAKASTERITMPQASTAIIFMTLLATPAVLRILG